MTRIWQIWDQAVEPYIAENAQPIAFKGSLLLINVTNSPWLQQLRFMETDLIRSLNDTLGETLVSETLVDKLYKFINICVFNSIFRWRP